MTILVTGANGQLGCELRRLVAEKCVGMNQEWIFSDVVDCGENERLWELTGKRDAETLKLDICDERAVRELVRERCVSVIVNCAAYNNVERAECDEVVARRLNVEAPSILARAMKEVDGLLVHISSDYVFGGEVGLDSRATDDVARKESRLGDIGFGSSDRKSRAYTEKDVPAPLGVYGQSKLDGERAVREVGGRAVVIRTAWLYSEFGKNFLKTMLALTSSKPEIKVVNDQVGTPTYALDLAQVVLRIVASNKGLAADARQGAEDIIASEPGALQIDNGKRDAEAMASNGPNAADTAESDGFELYHYSGGGQCSWYEFACEIAKMAGHNSCRILPCTSEEFGAKVKRPAYSVLDKSLISKTYNLAIPDWKERLKVCIRNLSM